jgi:hypothetical protein
MIIFIQYLDKIQDNEKGKRTLYDVSIEATIH